MTKPQSYPFLAIANRYRIPYGEVLMVADHWRKRIKGLESDRTTFALHNALLWPHEALEDITNANAEFAAIQAGKTDWQTGEPRYSGLLRDFQAQGRALRPVPKPGDE